MIEFVTWRYKRIDVSNKGVLHLVNVGKGALGQFDDVGMPKMRVGCEPNQESFNLVDCQCSGCGAWQ